MKSNAFRRHASNEIICIMQADKDGKTCVIKMEGDEQNGRESEQLMGEELDGNEHLVIYDEQVLCIFQDNSKCNKEQQRIFLSVHCAGDFTIILFLLKWLLYLVLFVTLLLDNQLSCDELPVTLCLQSVLALILSSYRVHE